MAEDNKVPFGSIGWIDLTVKDAPAVRDFYSKVAGWSHQPVTIDDYNDYCMFPPGSKDPISGICHARGLNSDLPAQWLMYIHVESLDKALTECVNAGGKVIGAPRNFGADAVYAVIQDPAGAYVALFQPKP